MHASASLLSLLTLLAPAIAKDYNCVPGQPCWPSNQEWADFNKTVGGVLRVTIPLAAPCYGPNSNAAACKSVEGSYQNGTYRTENYGNMQSLNWEVCGKDQCQINTASPQTPPIPGTCSLGTLSAYYVAATTADHVSKTLLFVDKHQLRLSIKNTGHDYFGRSVSPNSLALWTHNMKNKQYIDKFQAQNCPAANTQDVGIIGAGVIGEEAASFFQGYKKFLTIGAARSVGVAGGFGQGGGHGPLGPKYGLAVDNAIEFDVVTPDGKPRTINQCNDPDLFYAMRGGGGGTYAVLVSYKIKLHPATAISTYRYRASIKEPTPADIKNSAIWPNLFETTIAQQGKFSDNFIAGYNWWSNNSLEIILFLADEQPISHLKDLTKEYRDFLVGLKGVQVIDDRYDSFATYAAWQDSTDAAGVRNGPVGVGVIESTRLVPRTLFDAQTKSKNMTLKNALLDAGNTAFHKALQLQIYATGPANQPDNSKTGVNPAWRGSLWGAYWVAGYIMGEPQATIDAQVAASIKANDAIKAVTPGGGNYVNEGQALEKDWQQCFFGSNYNKLLDIKKRYDPNNMLNCYKCVGWNGDNDARYSCYGSNPQPTKPQGPVS